MGTSTLNMDIVMAQGTFDLLHPGHVKYFEASADLGERLAVVVAMDSMIDQGLFENALEEYWYGRTNGREGIKNMFYDIEDDSVGIVDLGEKRGRASPNRTPEVKIPSKYT